MSDRTAQLEAITFAVLDRELAVRHADALVRLNAGSDWDDWTVDNLLAERPEKWRLSSLASVDGDPVGYAIASRRGDDVHLHHLVVAPALRGSGLGARLLERLAAEARRSGAERLTLKVGRENEAAQRFYLRHGFGRASDDRSAEYLAMTRAAGDAA